jgi:putative nucleotidyltransferase with HDIG domain
MRIPATEECEEILEEFNVPENIREHSRIVKEIALLLAKKLKEKGKAVDLELVSAGALLHDLDKIATLKDVPSHGTVSKRWLAEKELFRVGEVVENHGPQIIAKENPGWEDKVVFYADKRCNHNKIVSLKERFYYIKNAYKDTFREEHEEISIAIEKEIFKNIDISPDDIK